MDIFKDWINLVASAQKVQATRLTAQLGLSVVFTFFILIWAEIALYLGLSKVFSTYVAALLVLAFNAIVLLGVSLAGKVAKRRVTAEKAEALKTREAARQELVVAKNELLGTAGTFVQNQFVVPYQRYRAPAAGVGAFAVGFLVARALSTQSRL
jgi:hypothetical protein